MLVPTDGRTHFCGRTGLANVFLRHHPSTDFSDDGVNSISSPFKHRDRVLVVNQIILGRAVFLVHRAEELIRSVFLFAVAFLPLALLLFMYHLLFHFGLTRLVKVNLAEVSQVSD